MPHTSSQTPQPRRKPRSVSTFLKKTYQLLNDSSNSKSVRWASDGIGFIVVNQDLFAQQVLPLYFKHNNYSSFVRQLNMYNFHKIRESNCQSYFHHQSFDRNDQMKLAEIKRKPEKKKRKSEESSDQESKIEQPKTVTKEQKNIARPSKKVEQQCFHPSLFWIQTQTPNKNSQSYSKPLKQTRHHVSQQHNQNRQSICGSERRIDLDDAEDKLSINNQISQRVIPRLATRELIYPSNNNLFPLGKGVTSPSTFCIFF